MKKVSHDVSKLYSMATSDEQRTSQRDRRYFLSFLGFYLLIFASWLFFMVFHFTTYFQDDSFVLSHYLLTGNQAPRSAIAFSWPLLITEIIVKINMVVVAGTISTIFLIYNILPRFKNLNAWWMVLGIIAAYLPSLLTIISFFQTGTTPISNYITLSKFMTLAVIYPLNFAVFFYLYYMIDTFVLNKKSA